ncbi:hypothetical protein CJJ07_004243 [Candidozyma auris]|nr:hypothetical protein CJJ07_004243 [[Candida] auris]QEL60788.1 hypothetical protein CJJ09_002906 [[Candida] auris]
MEPLATASTIPFDHTYILYNPNDLISTVCVQFSLLPIYIMVFYTSWFLITREIEPVIAVGGHLLGELTNKVVKCIVKQPRPDFHKDFGAGSYGLTYGMPSAHSQFMGFFASYYICTILMKVPLRRGGKAVGVLALGSAAFGVAFSRVYLMYHTIEQVFVGVLVGLVMGTGYFVVASLARDVGLVDWVLSWRIVRFFWVKDSYYHCYQTYKEEFEVSEGRKVFRKGMMRDK